MSNDTDREPITANRPIAVDTRTNRLGHVMGEYLGNIYLRPLLGGPEWSLPADRVRPPTAAEVQAEK